MNTRMKGFTLIELMVTVAIVAILASIAIPNYSEYVRKTRRTEARTALLNIAAGMERHLIAQNAYTDDLTLLRGLGEIDAANAITGNGYYDIAIVRPADATTPWSITTTAVTGTSQEKDIRCRQFVYWLTGRKTATDADGNDSTSDCWD